MPNNLETINKIKLAEGGRSAGLVFFTSHKEFVIKTINENEKEVLTDMLEDYYFRIQDPQSKLVRILGLFRIGPFKLDFIIMENVISSSTKAVIFDIKGCVLNREVKGLFDYSAPPLGKVLKDLNLTESGFKCYLSPESHKTLMEALNSDFELLVKYKIMDYSVLLAFYKKKNQCETRYDINGVRENYTVGVIDFLQQFNIRKRSERFMKKIIFGNTEFSTEDSPFYKNRIYNFLESYIVNNSENSKFDEI